MFTKMKIGLLKVLSLGHSILAMLLPTIPILSSLEGSLVDCCFFFKNIVFRLVLQLSAYPDSMAVVGTDLFVASASDFCKIDLTTMEKSFEVDLQNGRRENMGSLLVSPDNLVVVLDATSGIRSCVRCFDLQGKLIRKIPVDDSGGLRRGMTIWNKFE